MRFGLRKEKNITFNINFDKEGRVYCSGAALGITEDEMPVNLDCQLEPDVLLHHQEIGTGYQPITATCGSAANYLILTLQHKMHQYTTT